jgi:hypothetical protein
MRRALEYQDNVVLLGILRLQLETRQHKVCVKDSSPGATPLPMHLSQACLNRGWTKTSLQEFHSLVVDLRQNFLRYVPRRQLSFGGMCK